MYDGFALSAAQLVGIGVAVVLVVAVYLVWGWLR